MPFYFSADPMLLPSNKLDAVCRITICTIQRLYPILRGEELNQAINENGASRAAATWMGKQKGRLSGREGVKSRFELAKRTTSNLM
jgi:hypothetical protein